jgi:hypothetical protein
MREMTGTAPVFESPIDNETILRMRIMMQGLSA